MRQPTATPFNHKDTRPNRTTVEGWLALYGGPEFHAQRPGRDVRFVVTTF
ncbi:MAG: hypothetical protein ACRDZ3_01145 [Acidimicrobiia bacterium]